MAGFGRGTGTANNSAGQDNDAHHVLFDENSASVNSHVIDVYDVAWIIYIYNLPVGVTAQIQQVYGEGSGDTFYDFAPLPGAPMFLDENLTSIPLAIEGRYRLVLSDPTAVGVVKALAYRTTLPHQEYTHFYADIQRIRYDLDLDTRVTALEAQIVIPDTVSYVPATGGFQYTDSADGSVIAIDFGADQLLADDPGIGPAAGTTDVQSQLDAINGYLNGLTPDTAVYDANSGVWTYTDDVGGITAINFGASFLQYTDPGTGPAAGQTRVQGAIDAVNSYLDGLVADTVTYNAATGQFTYTDDVAGATVIDISDDQLLATDPGAGPLNGLTDVRSQLQALNNEQIAQNLVLGVPNGSTDLGTFTGTTIPDNVDAKVAFQTLETALEAAGIAIALEDTLTYNSATGQLTYTDTGAGTVTNISLAAGQLFTGGAGSGPGLGVTSVGDWLTQLNNSVNEVGTLTGVGEGATDMGVYGGAGTTLTDNGTIKAALEELEVAVEAAAAGLQTAAQTTYGGGGGGVANAAGDVENALDLIDARQLLYDNRQDALQLLTGRGAGQTNYGAMPGTVLADNQTGVQLFQAIDTALSGTPAGETSVTVAGSPAAGISLTVGGTNGHALTLAVNVQTLATAIAADATATQTIWDAFFTHGQLAWDGTTLCLDGNGNGDGNS